MRAREPCVCTGRIRYVTYGGRIARERSRLASASPTNSAWPRSNVRLRRSCSQTSAARQMFIERAMTSSLATVGRRERTQLRVTVTQRSTGAVAEGVIFFTGSGQTNQWEITALAEGRATFQAGPATVVGLARSSIHGQATDAHQWLVNVTLLNE